uniref:POU-specific domain-containing protein n=1 Tax=Erpetoichthys calabaricus TaxID=27687 RepID=A0A8C4RMZ3_ERPCA
RSSDKIREFAKAFKIRRLSLGLTQTQVGQALSATEGPAYSQSAICRFEKLDITPKSAQKIKPVLERWMAEAEARHRSGMQNLTEFIGSEPSKKRKRRTSFTPQALEILNGHFEKNTHPSEVVRVWFCNKRQALKNTIKRLKQHEPGTAVSMEPLTDPLDDLYTYKHNIYIYIYIYVYTYTVHFKIIFGYFCLRALKATV